MNTIIMQIYKKCPASMTSLLKRSTAHLLAVLLIGVAGNTGCDLFYAPQFQPDPLHQDSLSVGIGFTGGGRIFSVNTNRQSCNPSIAPSGRYSGSMLFLGYNELSVRVPDSLAEFNAIPVSTHDRLTVLDTTNTVRWYLMRSDLESSGYLQCPEWSTNVNYLTCLVGRIGKPHNGYAVRFSDREFLEICHEELEEFSYPHFWLSGAASVSGMVDSAVYYPNGFIQRQCIEQFFGTSGFKFVYALPSASGRLYYIDYSSEGDPVTIPLGKPEGKEDWSCSSPLISPDGNWVAWHCFSNASAGSLYSSYIQELKAGSQPILIADHGSDPHWWVDPEQGTYYIIYSVTYENYYTEYDFSDPAVADENIAGCTLKQKLTGSWKSVPSHIGKLDVDRSALPDTLIRLPFKGGLSHDGFLMGTAYKNGYIVELE